MVMAHFDSHAWITVSQSYTVGKLMRDLLKKLCKEEKKEPPRDVFEMDQYSLIEEMRNYLQQKRYIIVFDDVWSIELWGQIEISMLENNNGCRILITTRSMDVNGLGGMTSLQTLCYVRVDHNEDDDVVKLFREIRKLEQLRSLGLNDLGLTHDSLKSLQNISHLLFLYIGIEGYKDESMYFQHRGFQQLKELYLYDLRYLNFIIIDKRALRSLETLKLSRIYNLNIMPPDIQHLEKLQVLDVDNLPEKLQVLDVDNLPDEFEECIAPNGGLEHPSIQHVPLVRIITTYKGGTHIIHH
ncbi:hypothetical protein JHK86_049767 [Glycine max]|nr:hypothetical protein JHK86_049767 [Glycine max]